MILGVPTGGNIKVGYFDAAMRDLKAGLIQNWISAKSIYLSVNRNNIVDAFLKLFPTENLLWQVDDDIYWDPIVLPLLLEAAKDHPIVFADVSLGNAPTSALTWNGREFEPCWPHPSEKPFECDGCAGANFLIRRDIYEEMKAGKWFDRRMINGHQAGEDTSFFSRVREYGYKAFCLPALPLLHFRETPLVSPLIRFDMPNQTKKAN